MASASALLLERFGKHQNFSSSIAVCTELDWGSLNQSSWQYGFANDCCSLLNTSGAPAHPEKPENHRPAPTSNETWLFGLLSVSIICASSVLSLAIFPCIRRSTYDLTIKFMVALAVGSLVATGCLFLIPEALGIASLPDSDKRFAGYQYKCATICFGMYFFFLGEQLIKKLVLGRQARKHNNKELRERAISGDLTHTAIGDLPLKIVGYTQLDDQAEKTGTMSQRSTELDFVADDSSNNDANTQGHKSEQSGTKSDSTQSSGYKYVATGDSGNTSTQNNVVVMGGNNGYIATPSAAGESITQKAKDRKRRRPVQPVAYMILLGDGLHNFIDGLTIGSAYTISVLTGVSVSLAVLCEELPHELGDFAVMVNAGLSKKRAALYNFLCACSIFVGFAIGVLVGDALDGASFYIFSVAAGMFLYISLADMLPELVQGSHSHDHGFPDAHDENGGSTSREQSPDGNDDDLVHKLSGRWLFLVQNVGILTGFSILFVLSIYSGELESALESLAG